MPTVTGPLGLPITVGDASDQYTKYMDVAKAQTQPAFDEQKTAIEQATKLQADGYNKIATTTLNQAPLIRETYAKLADEFKVGETYEMTTAKQTGEQRIGGATAALANEGVQNAQGSFRAPITAEENALSGHIKEIADRYGAKYETLTAQMNQTVGQLNVDAAKYQAQGNNALADGLLKQADLKGQQTQQVAALASAMQKTQNDNEKQALQQIMDAATIENQRTMATIAASNAAESARHNRASEATANANAQTSRMNANNTAALAAAAQADKTMPKYSKDDSGGLQFKDYRGNPITAAQYVTQISGSKTPNAASVLEMMRTYGNDGDKATADAIQNRIEKGITGETKTIDAVGMRNGKSYAEKQQVPITGQSLDKVMNSLTKDYPYLFGGV